MSDTNPDDKAPLRYALNVGAWASKERVIESTLSALMGHIEAELSGRDEGDLITFSVEIVRMTDAEVEALQEWDGP